MFPGLGGMMSIDFPTLPAGPLTQMHVVVQIPNDGDARAGGTVHFGDGASTTVLVAEKAPTTASCGNVDEDGVGGLTLLTVTLRDVRTGASYTATILPTNGEADTRGQHPATVTLTGGGRTLTAVGALTIR